ncbi:sensor histidine kinase [Rhodovulum sp. DZ06]|uniref:sensor histidine kinase n=1 Tax=Rhodovulum sp. DZ06 TaxID=3425126 RepID=UPI003D351CAD
MLFRSLSGRLLLLTVIFVMLAEVAIFVPSVARFREDYLMERLHRAQIASLALLATPDDMVSPDLEQELLNTAGVTNIVLRRNAIRELILTSAMPPPVDHTVDLRGAAAPTLIRDAMALWVAPAGQTLRVIGAPKGDGGELIEITLPADPLRAAMVDYGLRVLTLSLIISIFTAILIVAAMRRFVVRPVTRVIDNMREFQLAPEDAGRVIRPASGIREIADAEKALAEMETELRAALRQRARLAALGEAVAKISHDLRNVVTTAQLFADRLAMSGDPAVRRVGPKLIRSLDRAEALCAATLDFGRAEEPAPELRVVALRALVEDVRDEVFADLVEAEERGEAASSLLGFVNAAPEGLTVQADPDHLHRILANLSRNARQALEASGRGGRVEIIAAACSMDGKAGVEIDILDDGPGLPAAARKDLFAAFKGSATRGGAGLGLAIAQELARGMGGALSLVASDSEGTRFRLVLPTAERRGPGAAGAPVQAMR